MRTRSGSRGSGDTFVTALRNSSDDPIWRSNDPSVGIDIAAVKANVDLMLSQLRKRHLSQGAGGSSTAIYVDTGFNVESRDSDDLR
jgi:hypothetical protein